MGLSNDLISQFVKATNDTPGKKQSTSTKGTIVELSDDDGNKSYYVKIDGSDMLTPINALTDVSNDDRVVVEINNHTATVTGNITSPSARTADVKDAKDKIVANTADIGTIKADYVKTGVLEAAKGRITDLEAKNADIENLVAQKATIEDLKAANAEIDNLKAKKADIDSLDAKYVDIDFTNIEKANIKEFFSKSGMIKDLTISNGYITGKLVAIEIDGDLIQTGTLVADKLVIKTEDGLLYKLNAEALGSAGLAQIEDPETLKEGLHGALILDKTIVAEKIKVKDLEAFGATIGGFKIDNDAIHSVVKESVDNTTRGIYMDNDGQLNVGDAFNFIKFYRDGNYKPLTVEPSTWSTTYRSYFSKVGDEYVRLSSDTAPTFETGKYYEAFYKLAVSADKVTFGSSRKNLQTALDEVANSSISGVDVEYYKSTSATELSGGSWNTTAPTWENGKYIWSRTKTTSADNTVSYSNPVCITGNTGAAGTPGEQGIGVSSIIEQYYLSTSEVEPTGGDWTNEQPTWSSGSYIWTRSFITWSDDTTSTTAPVLAQAINDANANAEQASADADKANDAADDAREVADRAYSEISKLNDAIKNLVVGKDGSTLMTQTADGWQFNFGNFKDTIDDIGKKTAYVHIDETDTGNPKIELGKADNKAKLTLTNEDIQFVVGSEVPTKVTNEGLDTDKIKVDNEIDIGNFVWKNRANGNLGLSWKGAGS